MHRREERGERKEERGKRKEDEERGRGERKEERGRGKGKGGRMSLGVIGLQLDLQFLYRIDC
ncbi:MAG: hypothetical protein DSY76_02265 [Bacteroidetes bacterium]|nr:MAG: hypothetical protein DSY76_02265 [Bacteroidota bacterium]